ncbi:hypothetical protein MKW98_004223 [Papaver atlanticum]|uniref:WRC domain-containing protein n=1 Tax=Papaver atlanticum TaxID=357466 RepID=A0AAD4XSA8_9MAGN|nr:hypothetical protein MKW98_004223 [Papaver atlanticum]
MRIRKLIAQKKVCPTLPSSTPTTIAVVPASSTVQSVPTICEEEERVNNLQTKKEEVGVCELNMSLWDVIPAKDLLYYFSDEDFKDLKYEEEEYDDDYDDDDKIADESVNAEEDQISIERNDVESKEDDEKTEEELVEKQYATAYKRKLWLKSLTKKNNEKRKRDCGDDIDSNVKEKKKKKMENGVVYCCKTDGKGWHCRSKAQKGKPLCKHHLIQMQRHIDDQRDNNQKKIQKLEKKTAKRGRPPKESSTNTTTIRGRKNKGKLSGEKSSEFVYYSGFGPLWGKNKRGRPPNEVKKQQDSEKEDAEEEDAKEEECEKLEERQEVIDEALPIDHPTSPKMNIAKEENVNNNGCMFIDDEFDDSDDSDEDCNGVNVRKRYRKPIKARSLASLF